MKKYPHLSLVEKDGESEGAQAGRLFHVASLSELSRQEIIRVETAVSEVSKKAALLGVAVTPRSWDLRPVVVCAEERSPSIIRFLGPEVTLSLPIHTRVQDLLERLKSFPELKQRSLHLEWATLDGQHWYRREMVQSTLVEVLQEKKELSFSELNSLARDLISVVEKFHLRGVVHGHIVLGNIELRGSDCFLLDPGIGAAVVQSLKRLGIEQFPEGYERESFAPELFGSDAQLSSSDLYGIGYVLELLFTQYIKKADGEKDKVRLDEIRTYLKRLRDPNPSVRPNLTQVREFFEKPSEQKQKQPPAGRILGKQVRMLMPGRIERGKIVPTGKSKPQPGAQPPSGTQQEALTPNSSPSSPAIASTPVAAQVESPQLPSEVKPNIFGLEVESDLALSDLQPTPQPAAAVERRQRQDSLGGGVDSGIGVSWRGKPKPQQSYASLSSLSFLLVAIMGFVVAIIYRSGIAGRDLSRGEIESAWNGLRPSEMLRVAEAAVDRRNPSQIAQAVILESIRAGKEISRVNGELLRVVFDERWESQLKNEDVRIAFALALGPILRTRMPEDLSFSTAHPAVILALSAFAGESAGTALRGIPANILTALPPPVGVAFRELVSRNKDLRAGDEAVVALSRIVALGITNSEDLVSFLSVEPRTRFRAFAYLFSEDNQAAQRALQILLNHPNLRLDYSAVKWGRTMDLFSSEELEASEKLLLLAGIAPTHSLSAATIGKLFSHPDELVRSFAIKKGLDVIEFRHPGAYDVLTQIAENPSILNGADTLILARFLEQPSEVTGVRARAFLESNPAPALISLLLLATSSADDATKLDFEFSRYLQGKKWDPSLNELRKLVCHPEQLTRLYAYAKVYALPDKDTSRTILGEALSKEQVPEFRVQLSDMLKSLN